MNSPKGNKLNIWNFTSFLIFLFFIIFIIIPLFFVLRNSVIDTETESLTMKYISEFFSKKFYYGTLLNSLKVTVTITLLSVIIGLPLAYMMRKVKIAGRKYLEILVIIAYISPPFIGAYAWIQLLGKSGFITGFLKDVFGYEFGGIYGFWGIVLVLTLQSFPLIYIYISGALKNMDSSLLEAAESLGCSGIKRMFTVIIPLITPTMLASALLVFMRVIADFGTPMLIGEGYRTLPVLIYNEYMGEVGGSKGFAAALSIIFIIVTLLLFFAQRVIASRYSFAMSTLNPMGEEKRKGIKNWLFHIIAYFIVFLGILPQVVVTFTSFLEMKGGLVYTGNFSLKNFENIFFSKNPTFIWNTYKIGIIAILIILIVGVLISYLTVRKKSIITSMVDTLSMFPFIMPGTVLGIAFLFAFSNPPLAISGTLTIMVLAFAIRRMPYTIRSSTAIIGQINPNVEEAAISLGASETKTFLKVLIPLMAPGILSGAVMSWITVISELSSSILLYSTKTQTLTVSIYTEVVRGNYGDASAYAAVLTITSIISLFLFFKLTGKTELD